MRTISSRRGLPPAHNVDVVNVVNVESMIAAFNQEESSPDSPPKPMKQHQLRWLRVALVDIPLLLVLSIYAGIVWTHYVHDEYLVPQIKAVNWTDQRKEEEMTYYLRSCTIDDMTTSDPEHLKIDPDATPEEAYQHQLLHGFSLFPQVLSPQTRDDLRDYIRERNKDIKPEESLYVIAGKNRFSFGLPTTEPVVRRAVRELAEPGLFRETLEKVVGPNPALMEMTVITSTYGAKNQFWHADVSHQGSPVNFAQSFTPAFSVFIQLQNTTAAMGATSVCPGSHYCTTNDEDNFCMEHGYQLAPWNAGDALLMNMNSNHRGAAHVDPNGEDRVMLLLTFIPRPQERADTRQLPMGITYSIRWDLWGHTLNDLAKADTNMINPWATLRSLGLFKLWGADWGVDFITSTCMRLFNDINAFDQDDLKEFIDRGGYSFLPSFLQGKYYTGYGCWYDFLVDTLYNVEAYVEDKVYMLLRVYVSACFLMALWKPKDIDGVFAALLRLMMLVSGVYLVFRAAVQHVDSTGWARDLTLGRRYTNPFATENLYVPALDAPTAYPNFRDILIENRLGNEYLGVYQDYIDGHTGNRKFLDMARRTAPIFRQYDAMFREKTAVYMRSLTLTQHRRVMQQGRKGNWFVLNDEQAVSFFQDELISESVPVVRRLRKKIRALIADLRVGIYRDSPLSYRHSVPFLYRLEQKILGVVPREPSVHIAPKRHTVNPWRSIRTMTHLSVADARHPKRAVSLNVGSPVTEPIENLWIHSGVEVREENESEWYVARIEEVTCRGQVSHRVVDGGKKM